MARAHLVNGARETREFVEDDLSDIALHFLAMILNKETTVAPFGSLASFRE
jgi:hypothetical protein